MSNIIWDFCVIPCKIKNNLSSYPWKKRSEVSKHANFPSQKYSTSNGLPNVSIFLQHLHLLLIKKWRKSHLVWLKSNRSTFDYDLDLSGQIIEILNLNWLILVILSYVWVLTSIYITFKLTFKLLDHFQQCGWIFRLVTSSEVYSSLLSLWGRYYERE